jgi:hypothetical protein
LNLGDHFKVYAHVPKFMHLILALNNLYRCSPSVIDGSLFNGSGHEMQPAGAGELLVSPGQSTGLAASGSVATDLLIDLGPGDQQFMAGGSHLVHRPRPTPKKAQSRK